MKVDAAAEKYRRLDPTATRTVTTMSAYLNNEETVRRQREEEERRWEEYLQWKAEQRDKERREEEEKAANGEAGAVRSELNTSYEEFKARREKERYERESVFPCFAHSPVDSLRLLVEFEGWSACATEIAVVAAVAVAAVVVVAVVGVVH